MKKACIECGKVFQKTKTQSIKTWNTSVKYCSKACQVIGVGRVSGKRFAALNRARVGTKIPESTKQKMRDNSFRKGKPSSMKGRTHSLEVKNKIRSSVLRSQTLEVRLQKSLSHRGDKNYNWKGGRTGLKHQIRNSLHYRQWRSDVFTRDEFTCVWCGDNRGGNLEADHVIPLKEILNKYFVATLEQALICEELWNINNGRTLCKTCHIKRHSN